MRVFLGNDSVSFYVRFWPKFESYAVINVGQPWDEDRSVLGCMKQDHSSARMENLENISEYLLLTYLFHYLFYAVYQFVLVIND